MTHADNEATGEEPNDRVGARGPLDPNAPRKEQTRKPDEEVQVARISPVNTVPVLAGRAALPPGPFMGTGGPTQAVPSAYDIFESLLRFKWTALIVFVLVAIPMITAIWTQIVPKYRAQAEVRIRPIIPFVVFQTEDTGMLPLYSSFVNTQVSIIRSPAVLERVLGQPQVQETQWYKSPQQPLLKKLRGATLSPLERLKDDLLASPRGGTEILDISFLADCASDAKVIVNAVLEEYTQHAAQMVDEDQDTVYRELIARYKLLEKDILKREEVTAELRKSLGTGTPEELISSQRIRLDEAQAHLAQVQQRVALLKWEIEQRATADSNDAPNAYVDDPTRQLRYHQDAEWRALDINLKTIRHNIDNSVLTSKHPDAIRMEKDLEFAKELLRSREAQLDDQWRDRRTNSTELPTAMVGTSGSGVEEPFLSLGQQLAWAQQEGELLAAECEQQQQKFKDLFASAQLLQKENSDLLHARELFDTVRRRLDQKNMERDVFGRVEMLTEAQAGTRPYRDRRMVFTVMALLMGMGMGGGVAFLRASSSKVIYAAKDMPCPMQVPFLGYIPEIGRTRPSDVEASHALTESVRFVRAALLSRLDSQDSTTILVTSAGPGTGKSSFTLMLGKSLAQAGKKVLMIDVDFHRMTLTNLCQTLSDKSGFIQSLRCGSVYRRHIFSMDTSGLSIVPAGKRGGNDEATEEIASGTFKACIGKLRRKYNIILLDSSPILPLADSVILSSQVDGVILVERERISSRSEVNGALERLGAAGGRLLGTVFIGSSHHQKYGYGYYYGKVSRR